MGLKEDNKKRQLKLRLSFRIQVRIRTRKAIGVFEAILAVTIEDNSAGCLVSALEEFLIAGGAPSADMMNVVSGDKE